MTQMRFDLEAGERAKGHGMAAAATAGQWVKSRRVSNHARAIRVWRLK